MSDGNQNGWNEYSRLVLKELETLADGIESLRSEIQEVKQEAFRISWPTKKDTMTGALMVFGLASIAAIFFLLLDQILRFLLNIVLNLSF